MDDRRPPATLPVPPMLATHPNRRVVRALTPGEVRLWALLILTVLQGIALRLGVNRWVLGAVTFIAGVVCLVEYIASKRSKGGK